jgi:hypothetical protein
MSTNTSSNEDQEIDLTQLFKKFDGFLQGIKASIFKCIQFFLKNKAVISVLLLLGFGTGIYLDTTLKTYTNEIIVSPNMGGTDYLYSKIDLISSKLKEQDDSFFKSIGINNPNLIKTIQIEPVIDIYNFVNNSTSAANAENTQNFELVKLLAEEGSLKEVIKDKLTSKNYPHHKITIVTSTKTSEKQTIDPVLKYLNTDSYLNKILAVSIENIKIKMIKNQQLINQTDSLIKILTLNVSNNQKNTNLVYNNESNQFNPLFDLKNSLINEIGGQKIALINTNRIVKDISTVINIRNTKNINGKLKFVFPLILIFGFILTRFFINFYKRQKVLFELNQ